MSDDFEDVSVEVTPTEPVAAAVQPAPEPIDIPPVAPPSEPAPPSSPDNPVDISRFSSSKQDSSPQGIAEQAAQESGAINNNLSDGRAPVTDAGRFAKEEADKEKRENFIQAQEQSEAMRKQWLEKDHDFAGMKMSGHDIDKLIHFYANNPQMLDKLQEKMATGGRSPKQAKEAVDAFKEYMSLMERQSKGDKLSPEDQRRMMELSKREDVREVAREATELARRRGSLSLSSNNDSKTALATYNDSLNNKSQANLLETQASVAQVTTPIVLNDVIGNDEQANLSFASKPPTSKSSVSFAEEGGAHGYFRTVSLTDQFRSSNVVTFQTPPSSPDLSATENAPEPQQVAQATTGETPPVGRVTRQASF